VTSVVRTPQGTAAGVVAQPYAPSWVNRVTAWVERLPGPPWAFYAGLWLALFVAETLIKWRDGAYPVGTFFPFHAILAGNGLYGLAVCHYTLRLAGKTLHDFRPVLTLDEAGYQDLRYRFTTVPARPTLLASLLAVAIILPWLPPSPGAGIFAPLKLFTSPLALSLDVCLFLFFWWVLGTAIYGTVYLLRMVRRIHATQTHIDLVRPGPLYALSRLTAFIAIAISIGVYIWVALTPEAVNRPIDMAPIIVLPLLAFVVFVWPLLGLHRRLVLEKEQLLGEAAERLEENFALLHRRLESGDLGDMDALNKALNSLALEENRLAHIPTWPWRPEVPRTVITVIFLPIVLWLIQRILSRLLDS
jgi:hypothetical protein